MSNMKFAGITCWTDRDGASPVHDVVLTEKRIAFDVMHKGYDYTVSLAPAPAGDGWWKGTWRCADASGHVETRLYRSAAGGVVLAGRWVEDETNYHWFTELKP